ncbi:M24 family metallopeptidase [Granulicella cerasi]|uniref:M24 family metallopeptidase n=1 Tax=Granulicella cerasi TaxID=741063 RepID=A0ABW1ZF99_9BACT|nr:M24 family metallopeptidase [Granulicella cerasi]
MNLDALQTALRDNNLDGWLFYDHHHRDPIAYRILGLDANSFVSRRWFYFVPAYGQPKKLVHRIEPGKLDTLPGAKEEYSSWQELEAKLAAMLGGARTVAMQYSPRNAIMYVAMVDAGTVELVRSFGKDVRSSADLVSVFEAVLTEEQIATHYVAQQRLDGVLQAAWKKIGDDVRAGRAIGEIDVVNFLLEGIAREGLFTDHGPNCSAGPNSADSHYEPTRDSSRLIQRGDFVLIDVWAKLANDPSAIWYDITWTGVVDREPTERETLIFNTVRDARDASIAAVEKAYAEGRSIAGWEADDASRNVIREAGFGQWFTHRTGHNIAIELHGNGAHLDNLETHDERLLLPNTCFSVEPGIYFPGEFGVRSEVNMITRPGKAVVTGPRQTELVRI